MGLAWLTSRAYLCARACERACHCSVKEVALALSWRGGREGGKYQQVKVEETAILPNKSELGSLRKAELVSQAARARDGYSDSERTKGEGVRDGGGEIRRWTRVGQRRRNR
jgi:hypothetical protein